VVPGWLDKAWKWRDTSPPTSWTAAALLAPNPEWIKTLAQRQPPDRTDFTRYGNDLEG
jgi:hypothetical protein